MTSPPLSWNRYPRVQPANVFQLHDREADLPPAHGNMLPHGNGRSYGDVCLNEGGSLLMTRGLDRFIEFDINSGVLRCESGVTLAEILALVVPRGWFLQSTPGTRYVTIGGALANDVHGKNHHSGGTFGHHVRQFELVRSNGERIICDATKNSDWFCATIGGLGLTGLVSWVEIQLMPIESPWISVVSDRFGNLDEFWALNDKAESEWPYTAAWIDCLAKGKSMGRGIYFMGQHAPENQAAHHFREPERRIPIDPPISLVNSLSLRVFNALYYRQSLQAEGTLSHYLKYFYPLDSLKEWNRIYGRRGFFQYQCVLPPEHAQAGVTDLLEVIAASGQGSFLAVLKTFGPRPSIGMLSFARPGATLALDFPNQGAKTMRLLKSLDAVVRDANGAIYPAKDARMPPDLFRSGYPRWEDFSTFIDPMFSSSFWRRVTT
jgi:FAD/FMN-containing dehydrogenase